MGTIHISKLVYACKDSSLFANGNNIYNNKYSARSLNNAQLDWGYNNDTVAVVNSPTVSVHTGSRTIRRVYFMQSQPTTNVTLDSTDGENLSCRDGQMPRYAIYPSPWALLSLSLSFSLSVADWLSLLVG